MNYCFWPSRRARSVQDEQWILCFHWFGRAISRARRNSFVVPDVPTFNPVDLRSRSTDNDYGCDPRALLQCFVSVVLEWHSSPAANTLVCSDQRIRVAVL